MVGNLGDQTPYTPWNRQSLQRHPSAHRHLVPTRIPNLLELGSKIRAQYMGVTSLLLCGFQGSNSGHQAASKHPSWLSYLTDPLLNGFTLRNHVPNTEFTNYHSTVPHHHIHF